MKVEIEVKQVNNDFPLSQKDFFEGTSTFLLSGEGLITICIIVIF